MTDGAVAWAERLLRANGSESCRAERIGGGAQSTLWRLDAMDDVGEPSRYALKVFNDAVAFNSPGAVRDEVAALERFHEALVQSPAGVDCSRPLAVMDGGRAYLMSFADGLPLNTYLLREREDGWVIGQIIRGLGLYHDALGGAYADCTPNNVLVTGSGVIFLDPTMPDPFFAEVEGLARHGPGAVDLGFWLQDVAGNATRMSVERPLLLRRRIAFTRRLLRAGALAFAGADRRPFTKEAAAVARVHLRRYRRKLGAVRRAVHWAITNVVLTVLVMDLPPRVRRANPGPAAALGDRAP